MHANPHSARSRRTQRGGAPASPVTWFTLTLMHAAGLAPAHGAAGPPPGPVTGACVFQLDLGGFSCIDGLTEVECLTDHPNATFEPGCLCVGDGLGGNICCFDDIGGCCFVEQNGTSIWFAAPATLAACDEAGGTWSPFLNPESAGCDYTRGCCLADGSCVPRTLAACATDGGTPLPLNADCRSLACSGEPLADAPSDVLGLFVATIAGSPAAQARCIDRLIQELQPYGYSGPVDFVQMDGPYAVGFVTTPVNTYAPSVGGGTSGGLVDNVGDLVAGSASATTMARGRQNQVDGTVILSLDTFSAAQHVYEQTPTGLGGDGDTFQLGAVIGNLDMYAVLHTDMRILGDPADADALVEPPLVPVLDPVTGDPLPDGVRDGDILRAGAYLIRRGSVSGAEFVSIPAFNFPDPPTPRVGGVRKRAERVLRLLPVGAGACCMNDGTCLPAADVDACERDMGGTFQGEGSSCGTVTCITPCELPGRPDPTDPQSGRRAIRGYIVGWAVDTTGREIRWNHLAAGATILDYPDGTATDVPAVTFQAVAAGVDHGDVLPDPGTLNMDGVEYASGPEALLLHFQADGSSAWSSPDALLVSSTQLTLMPLDSDFRDGAVPPATNAMFDIWNENELKLSGTRRCVTCWDSVFLRQYDVINHLVIGALQTDHGKARITGTSHPQCPESQPRALIGFAERRLSVGPWEATAGSPLTPIGARSAVIVAPLPGAPDESPDGTGGAGTRRRADLPTASDDVRPGVRRGRMAQRGGAAAPLAGTAGSDLVSASAPGGAEIIALPAGPALPPRMHLDKGSLFIIPRVEMHVDAQGMLVRDTLVTLTNDFPQDVLVQMWFVNGDPPLTETDGPGGPVLCEHPGWNAIDTLILLTRDQPVWWSVATGQPLGLSPFTVLDP